MTPFERVKDSLVSFLPGRDEVRLPVLLYHRVGPADPDPKSAWLTVTPESFEKQMSWLQRFGFNTIHTKDWVAFCTEGRPLPPRPVLITFDDGYVDCAEYALPVLERLGMKAIIYLVTTQIGGENIWELKSGFPIRPLMNAESIRYWAARGIEFGGHSRTHANLTQLTSEELEEEVAGCQRDLTNLLGAPVDSYAYPFGAVNDKVRDAAREVYTNAVGCGEGMTTTQVDRFDLLRNYVFPHEHMLTFISRIHLGYSLVGQVKLGLKELNPLRARSP